MDIFTKFYNVPTKNEQDLYLQGLIDSLEVKQRWPRKDENKQPRGLKSASFSYIILGVTQVQICLKAFLSVFDISEKRVRRIRSLKLAGKTPEDKRGKGISHQLPPDVHNLVNEHINFPLKESHYSGKKLYYLSADLNIKSMWKMFSEQHPQVKVSLYFYWTFYKDNFNYQFGRPQVDTCCKCEELGVKIKSPYLNDVAKRTAVTELLVHKRQSKTFYSALQCERSEGRNEKHILSLAFDYMKTVSLPKIPVQQLFYMRQLSVNVFSIHDVKKGTSPIFIYQEGSE